MKRIASLLSLSTYLTFASNVLAESRTFPEDIKVAPPKQGYSDLGAFISNILTLAFSVAVIIVLVMMVWGGIEWMLSGGDKEAVGKARGKIVNALIGLAILAVAIALAVVAGRFLGFDSNNIFNIVIPKPK